MSDTLDQPLNELAGSAGVCEVGGQAGVLHRQGWSGDRDSCTPGAQSQQFTSSLPSCCHYDGRNSLLGLYHRKDSESTRRC